MTYVRARYGLMIAALGLLSTACTESPTVTVETALVVSVVEDTIAAAATGGGTWTSNGLTLELRNRSETETITLGNCGAIRLHDRFGETVLDMYCPIPMDASLTQIAPGESVTIGWEQLDCPHAQCALAFEVSGGDVGEYLVRVFYHLGAPFSEKTRLGDYTALSQVFAVTLE